MHPSASVLEIALFGAANELEYERFDWRWRAPGSDTAQPSGAFPWKAGQPARFIGEIKPHTRSGVSAGRAQLKKRLTETQHRGAKGVLVTYRKKKGTEDRVEVLVELADQPNVWFNLGYRHFDWKQLVSLEKCPACTGAMVEGTVRDIFRDATKLKILNKPNAQVKGADIISAEAERSAFLAELVGELVLQGEFAVGGAQRPARTCRCAQCAVRRPRVWRRSDVWVYGP